ncbi:hypothetical protein AALO_G00099650 [Alosa alosa]|uniref:ribonuclease H n=1 Tax=Alosa alosa TaxID=278164 RepID=A0AAV6GTP4_9TELE|nr:hypothetical protein AALO_G00099650 [Alosa alosa]
MNKMAQGEHLKPHELRVVVLGGYQSGKTSLINTVLSQEPGGGGRDARCLKREGDISGRRLTLIDTPGWWTGYLLTDTAELVKQDLVLSVCLCAPGPHAFLLTVETDAPFTEKKRKVVEQHLNLFGEDIWRHTIVVVTRGDSLKGKSIEQHIESEGDALKWVIGRCENRYHVVDSHSKDPDQVTDLVNKLEAVYAANSGSYFQIDRETLKEVEEKNSAVKLRATSRQDRITEQRQMLEQHADTCQRLDLIHIDPKHVIHSVNTHNLPDTVTPKTAEEIVSAYEDVFYGLGCLRGKLHLEIDHKVRPVQQLPRRTPIPIKDRVTTAIREMEQKGIIAKVTEPTPWISNMVGTEKKDKLRICLDPGPLNKAPLRSHYQMPTVEEILPDLAKAKIFSVLDAKDGYWQVRLDQVSSYLTTFWTPIGRYRWVRMPFGIKPAAEEYQRRQHEALRGLKGVSVIADDILVYGCGDTNEEAVADHDNNLKPHYKEPGEVNLKLNKKKAEAETSQCHIHGSLHIRGPKAQILTKITAVQNMQTPTDVKSPETIRGL